MSNLPPGFVLDGDPQSAGPVYGPPPKPAAPPAPPTPLQIKADHRADTLAGLAVDRFNYQKQQDANKPGAAGGGLTAEATGKLKAQLDGAHSMMERVKEIEERYNRDFKGVGIGSIAEYLPATIRPANGEFDDASNAVMGDIAAAYGLTAQQQNTPQELKIRFGPFIPSSSDPDGRIEAKIKRLKAIAKSKAEQAARQLGIPTETPAAANSGGWGKARRVR
jgi:hypothetical protein